jgi:co-chaperonin GroES (HSP10)
VDIKPTTDNVLIKVDVEPDRSPGGIYLFSGKFVVKNSGVVMAVGDSEVIKVKPGDRVLFDKGVGHRFKAPVSVEVSGVTFTKQEFYILIPYFEIVAVVGDD